MQTNARIHNDLVQYEKIIFRLITKFILELGLALARTFKIQNRDLGFKWGKILTVFREASVITKATCFQHACCGNSLYNCLVSSFAIETIIHQIIHIKKLWKVEEVLISN